MFNEQLIFNILDEELARAFKIPINQLIEITNNLVSKQIIKVNDHFIYCNKQWNVFFFSRQGAFALANYLDEPDMSNIWTSFIQFIEQKSIDLVKIKVTITIYEHSGNLLLCNNRHFLRKRDVARILCTNVQRLDKAFFDLRDSYESLEPEIDFFDFQHPGFMNSERYYSFSGLEKLSRKLALDLTDKKRRTWCQEVANLAPDILETRSNFLIQGSQDDTMIEYAKDLAKKRDKNYCQVTLKTPTRDNRFSLAVHHLYDKKHYPHLAGVLDNLITIKETIHNDFHAWNGGTQKKCTIDDFIQFIMIMYMYKANQVLISKLYDYKNRLTIQL